MTKEQLHIQCVLAYSKLGNADLLSLSDLVEIMTDHLWEEGVRVVQRVVYSELGSSSDEENRRRESAEQVEGDPVQEEKMN